MMTIPGQDQITAGISPDGLDAYVSRAWGARWGRIVGGVVTLTVIAICSAVLYQVGHGAWSVVSAWRVGGALPAISGTGALLGGESVVLIAALTAVGLQSRALRKLRVELAGLEIGTAQDRERILALEAHTDIHGLQKLLAERNFEEQTRLTIHRARYGIGETDMESEDVTDVLRGRIRQNRLDMVINNDTLGTGNVFAKRPKTLFVEYSVGKSERVRITVPETHKLVVPELSAFLHLAQGQ